LGAAGRVGLPNLYIAAMLNAAKGRGSREGPLAEINSLSELEAWLRKQPLGVSVAFAARAALRVLPILHGARGSTYASDFFADILPVFRATGLAWAAAKYPAQATQFRASAASAATAADAAAQAARLHAGGRATSADYARRTFWSAVSIDATRMEKGAAASVIAGLPLWPQGQPDRLQSLWQEMKAALLAANQDWQVWTDWYDDRLAGHVRDEERELAYMCIEEALWEQGPAIVNAEIRRMIEKHGLPAPIENVPSAVSFGWSSKRTITVVAGHQNCLCSRSKAATRITQIVSKPAAR
jgi:hypothetical protein